MPFIGQPRVFVGLMLRSEEGREDKQVVAVTSTGGLTWTVRAAVGSFVKNGPA